MVDIRIIVPICISTSLIIILITPSEVIPSPCSSSASTKMLHHHLLHLLHHIRVDILLEEHHHVRVDHLHSRHDPITPWCSSWEATKHSIELLMLVLFSDNSHVFLSDLFALGQFDVGRVDGCES